MGNRNKDEETAFQMHENTPSRREKELVRSMWEWMQKKHADTHRDAGMEKKKTEASPRA